MSDFLVVACPCDSYGNMRADLRPASKPAEKHAINHGLRSSGERIPLSAREERMKSYIRQFAGNCVLADDRCNR